MIKSTNCSLYLQILSIFTDPIKNALSFRSLSAYNISVAINGDVLIYYPSDYSTVAVGDYYSVTSGGQPVLVKNSSVTAAISAGITPIAVVFSTSPSNTDQGHGWNHGYAMALKEAGTGAWSTYNSSLSQSVQQSSYTQLTTYYDGYTLTQYIKNRANYSSSTFPAFYIALNYGVTAPVNSSGWFLPSSGQWYQFLVQLGTKGNTNYKSSNSTGDYYFTVVSSSTIVSNLNSYFTKLTSGTYTNFPTTYNYYWTSSEYDNSHAINGIFFHSYGTYFAVTTGSGSGKTETNHYIRPCIAF